MSNSTRTKKRVSTSISYDITSNIKYEIREIKINNIKNEVVENEFEDPKVPFKKDVKSEIKTEIKTESSQLIKSELDIKPELEDYKPDIESIKAEDFTTLSKNIKKSKNTYKAAPPNWLDIYEGIKTMRSKHDAPVDLLGAEALADINEDIWTYRFQVLVSVMLSSQTKDEQTAKAFKKLKAHGLNISNIISTSEEKILELIYGVGFHNRKAQYLKQTANILQEKYSGKVPNTLEEICSLPGVGPKMAVITLKVGFNIVAGISVDTHVHRIANRLNWANSSTPEGTRLELQSWVPKEYWSSINLNLVGFGQQICNPINPKCNSCLIKHLCPVGKKVKPLKSV